MPDQDYFSILDKALNHADTTARHWENHVVSQNSDDSDLWQHNQSITRTSYLEASAYKKFGVYRERRPQNKLFRESELSVTIHTLTHINSFGQ